MEEWRPVQGYEGRLEVSNKGRVKTLASVRSGVRNGIANRQIRPERILSPFLAKTGYPTVAPQFGSERKKLLVHRLVAQVFVSGHFDEATVNHIDGNKLNNDSDNLEWVSLAKNTALQWETGLINLRGQRHPSAKLTNEQVAQVRMRLETGESQSSIARDFGVSSTLIWSIKHGRKRTKYSGPM